MSTKAIVLGAGFSGLSAAAYLARHGFKVEILEKNPAPGGRARKLESNGFIFDMGPSWYQMPEVFDNFFADFDYQTSDFYQLKRLDPSYRIFFKDNEIIDIPSRLKDIFELFERLEPNSSKKLERFLRDAHKKYLWGMDNVVFKPGLSVWEFFDYKLITGFLSSKSLRSLSSYVRALFNDYRIIQILEFPTIFLGALPKNIPAFYSLINYADLKLGTWYPIGGIYKVVEAMAEICQQLDVEITYNVNIDQLDVLQERVIAAHAGYRNFYADYFVSSVDYHHTEQHLLREKYRNYTDNYWESRLMAPSALLFYIGFNKKIPHLLHHNLIFDTDFNKHALDIYKAPQWPESPVMYISANSVTDPTTAPEGQENIIVLIPVAPGLEDHGKVREYYFDMVIKKIEKISATPVRDHIVYHKSYAQSNFIADYNSFKGNAYGLANTIKQTGPFRPKIKNRRLPNLFYTGQLTVPGPGVPASIISGKVVAEQVFKTSGGYKS